MKRRHVLTLIAASLTLSCTSAPGSLSLAPNSTLIVVRHSDRSGENLSAAGRARSQALVTALEGQPLSAIHAPGIQRNLDTAAPLSADRNLPIKRIAQESPTARLLRSAAGSAVIWVGNKGNIATIWEDLNLPDPAPLNYGDLFIIRSDGDGTVTIDRRHFGAR